MDTCKKSVIVINKQLLTTLSLQNFAWKVELKRQFCLFSLFAKKITKYYEISENFRENISLLRKYLQNHLFEAESITFRGDSRGRESTPKGK